MFPANGECRAPDIDHEVRWSVIKLADTLIRGADEVPPKVTIHLPPTPVQEVAPPLPAVKVPLKAHRPPKLSGPPARSPLTPYVQPKVKLSRVGSVDVNVKTPATEQTTPRVAFTEPKATKPKARAPKGDRGTHVPKAQSSGMSINDLRACRNALKKMQTHKHATLFLQPVDPVRDHAPKYVADV